MTEVVWTRRSFRELASIGDYIAERNPAAARKTLAAIHDRTKRLLSENPFIAVLERSMGRVNPSYRARLTLSLTASWKRGSKCSSCSTAQGNGPKTSEPQLSSNPCSTFTAFTPSASTA